MGIGYINDRSRSGDEWDEIYVQILEDYLNYGITSIFIKPKLKD